MHEELDKASLALVVEDQDELDHLSLVLVTLWPRSRD